MPKSIHNLAAFQRALDMVVEVYGVTAAFPKYELYGLTAQMRRAAIGVPSNIAEGQGRLSYGEWRQFFSQARGSLFEVEAQLLIAERLGFATNADLQGVRKQIRAAGKALSGFIEWVKTQERSTKQPSNSATKQPLTATPQSTPSCPPESGQKTRPRVT